MPSSIEPVVWWVEHGEYSDYGIDAVFSTEELANQVAGLLGEGYPQGYRVVGVTVYDRVPERKRWFVKEMNSNDVRSWSQVRWEWDGSPFEGRMTRGIGFQRWKNHLHQDNYRFYGFDKQRVHKAFDDYRARGEAEEAEIT